MNERDIRPTLTATPNEPMPVNESNTIRIDAKCNCGSDEFAWKVSDPSVSLYRQPISALLTGSKPGKYTITAADAKGHEADVEVEYFDVK